MKRILSFVFLIVLGIFVFFALNEGAQGIRNPFDKEADPFLRDLDQAIDDALQSEEAQHVITTVDEAFEDVVATPDDTQDDDESADIKSTEAVLGLDSSVFNAGQSQATLSISGDVMTMTSNGLPSHSTGAFPNAGNPNTISTQNTTYQIAINPKKVSSLTEVQVPGVALNGVFFEPGTAEVWGNDPASGWNYEGLQDSLNLGMDTSNAHVQPTGAYHYHGVPTAFIEQLVDDDRVVDGLIQIGWAADGFPIVYSIEQEYRPSYRLRVGMRPDGPGGVYDGTFTQDFEYVTGLGQLDRCNGTIVAGQYMYFATEDFPYLPRCVSGNPDSSFSKGPDMGGGGPRPGQMPLPAGSGHPRPRP